MLPYWGILPELLGGVTQPVSCQNQAKWELVKMVGTDSKEQVQVLPRDVLLSVFLTPTVKPRRHPFKNLFFSHPSYSVKVSDNSSFSPAQLFQVFCSNNTVQ